MILVQEYKVLLKTMLKIILKQRTLKISYFQDQKLKTRLLNKIMLLQFHKILLIKCLPLMTN